MEKAKLESQFLVGSDFMLSHQENYTSSYGRPQGLNNSNFKQVLPRTGFTGECKSMKKGNKETEGSSQCHCLC